MGYFKGIAGNDEKEQTIKQEYGMKDANSKMCNCCLVQEGFDSICFDQNPSLHSESGRHWRHLQANEFQWAETPSNTDRIMHVYHTIKHGDETRAFCVLINNQIWLKRDILDKFPECFKLAHRLQYITISIVLRGNVSINAPDVR